MANQRVAWDDVGADAGYRVKWGTSTGTYGSQADVATDTLYYDIPSLTPGTTYYWVVMALVGGSEQTQSAEASFRAGIPIGRVNRGRTGIHFR